VVALNASNGELIWLSERLSLDPFINVGAPPTVFKDRIVIGSSGGDVPGGGPGKGAVTGLDRNTGR
jgi:outer membrane protein assembly factor BamB